MRIVYQKSSNKKDIIKLLNKMLIDLELKKADIAYKMGKSEGTIRNLFNPNNRPDNSITVDTLAAICDAMDCDLVLEIRPRDQGGNS